MRPVSTNRPRNSRPSACRFQPKASPCRSNLNGIGSARLELHPALQLLAEPLDAAVLQDVFQPRVLPVGAVAEIAMDRQHRLGHLHHFLRRQKADDVRQPREGRLVAVAAAHAAAGGQVVAEQLAAASPMAMKPQQLVKMSMSFSGGMAKAILNLRGR